LPSYIRDEISRIYADLRFQGLTQRTRLEKQLAKITWLACLIHSYPRPKEEINSGLKELYGHGIGKIPKVFLRAASTRWMKFTMEKVGNQTYLYASERIEGKRIHHGCLGTL
jgi:transcription initiation factor TFIIIB Brf1 subunit/transcription initiation factor TFIIB